MTPVELLRVLYPNHAPCFGITAKRVCDGATMFRWRNYATGESGALCSASCGDAIAVASALLDELRVLRQEAAKTVLMKTASA